MERLRNSLRKSPHGRHYGLAFGQNLGKTGRSACGSDETAQLDGYLVLAVLAVICGADNFVAMALFGQLHEAWLRTFLALPNGMPSHDTLGRVLARRDATQFEEGFLTWVQSAFTLTAGQVVPIDGKCVRGSHDRNQGLGPLPLVSAWAQANRLVRAQTAVADKSNEITAIPHLLRLLCLRGCIVTLDALGCQKAIAHLIREQKADYVLGVKQNQKGLYDRLQDTFTQESAEDFADCPHDFVETVEKDHGRVATRRCWTLGDPAYLAYVDPHQAWCDLTRRVWVEAERRCGDQVTTEVRCFISRLPPQAKPLLNSVRQPWSIENTHHWVMDVAFREDDSRIRTGQAAPNMAILRRIAHNLLPQDQSLKVGVAHKRLAAAWNKDYLCHLIGLKQKPI